jgi:hypothetical protein
LWGALFTMGQADSRGGLRSILLKRSQQTLISHDGRVALGRSSRHRADREHFVGCEPIRDLGAPERLEIAVENLRDTAGQALGIPDPIEDMLPRRPAIVPETKNPGTEAGAACRDVPLGRIGFWSLALFSGFGDFFACLCDEAAHDSPVAV